MLISYAEHMPMGHTPQDKSEEKVEKAMPVRYTLYRKWETKL